MIVWEIDERGNIHTGQTLKDQFFDGKTVHLDLARDVRMQIRFLRRQPANHLQDFLAKFILYV